MRSYYIQSMLPFLCFLILANCAKKENTLLNTFIKVDKEILKNSKAYATLQESCNTIGHRLTGSENGHKAEEYVYNKLKEYGFEDVKYDDFEVESWSRGDIAVEINGIDVPAVSLAHSPTKTDLSGLLVDMGNGLENDYTKNPGAVKGKIALVYIGILEGSPKNLTNLHRSEKTSLAIKYGASGIIIVNQVKKGVLLTGTASVTGDLIPIPAVCIGKEDGMKIKEELKSSPVSAHIVMTNYSGPIKARNVIATITGSEKPEERILMTAHLDSWDLATGAIDNGIGSFSVLDIARSFKVNNLVCKRTLQFVLFMGEEEGLLGSRYMVEREKEAGTLSQIKFIMNLDMTGNPVGMNIGGKVDDKQFFVDLGAQIQQIDSVFENKFTNKSTLHSDHEPFMLEGTPYLDMISDLDQKAYDCYHSNCDTFDLIEEDQIRNNVRFGTMILYVLGNADPLPAKRTDSETTKQLMVDNDLQEPLTIAGDWKWGKEEDATNN